ncbi:MAG: response regulator [Terracidiphilus sp.]
MSKNKNFPTVRLEDVPASIDGNNANGYRPVVLVVDDESVIADTLAEILTRSGYTGVAEYDGDSALETALMMPPEMLITDVVLPGMTGIELAITVRRIFPDCKIILFSGQASTADLLASARADGHYFTLLNKPLHPQDLLLRVSEGLKSHRPVAAEAK